MRQSETCAVLPSDADPKQLAEETEFYGGYGWTLNPHISAVEAASHLSAEIAALATAGALADALAAADRSWARNLALLVDMRPWSGS